jgi:hypothetical protein
VEIGMPGMALALFAGPVYLSAAVAALLRQPLAYAVTAKGSMRSSESAATFRLHFAWAAFAAIELAASFLLGNDYLALRVWAGLTLFAGLGPPLIAACSALRQRWARRNLSAAKTIRGVAPAQRAVAFRVDRFGTAKAVSTLPSGRST